ncbi:MAG: hypothetical protein ACTHKS_07355 [Gaiellaceae bacterium]
MRFSAWSLRVISVCSALVFVPSAWAHLSVSPTRVAVDAPVDLTFGVSNEDDDLGVDHVTLTVPDGFELDDAEAKPTWTQSKDGASITWSGGRIPKGEYATFGIRGTAPRSAGPLTFNVLAGDRTGKSITYRVNLDVVSSTTRDSGARSLGKAAIAVALVTGALALVGLFIGIYVWLRPPPAA